MNLTDREMLIKVWGMLEKFDLVGGKELAKEIQDHLEKPVVLPKLTFRTPDPAPSVPDPVYYKGTTPWPNTMPMMWNNECEYPYKMANTSGTTSQASSSCCRETHLDNYLYDQKNP
jgi:hypothetical protein